jgi:hypothetical protein
MVLKQLPTHEERKGWGERENEREKKRERENEHDKTILNVSYRPWEVIGSFDKKGGSRGHIGTVLYFPLNFSMNRKLL